MEACAVCLESDGPLLRGVCGCKRPVHEACLRRCVEASGSTTCPTCRSEFAVQVEVPSECTLWALVGVVSTCLAAAGGMISVLIRFYWRYTHVQVFVPFALVFVVGVGGYMVRHVRETDVPVRVVRVEAPQLSV